MDNRPLTLLEKLESARRRKQAAKMLELEGKQLSESALKRIDEMDELGLMGEQRIEYIKTSLLAEFEAEDAARQSTA